MKPPPRLLLFAGMAAGLVLSLYGVTRDPAASLPEGVIARVGDQELLVTDYQRTVNSLQAERRKPLDADMRAQVLERLIDEYLLLQHARQLDLSFQVPTLRKRTVDQVLQVLRNQAQAMEPSEGELQRFLEENAGYFGLREVTGPDALQSMQTQVLREWRRRAAEDLLASLLEELRAQVSVQVRSELP